MKKSVFVFLSVFFIGIIARASVGNEVLPQPLISFSTGGHTVYHLKPATINKTGGRAIVAATFDGTVLCCAMDGTILWKQKVNNFFPFDLAVADINGDGLDEVFVATGGGTLDAYNPDGSHLWTFKSLAQLYQVCPIQTTSGDWVILTGGIEEALFALDSNGKLTKTWPAGDVVRHIRKGDIFGTGDDYAAVATASTGRNAVLSLAAINPETLEPVWQKTKLGNFDNRSRFMSMIIHDVNLDGKKDIVLSGSWEYNGRILAYDFIGQLILTSENKMVPNSSYRMLLLTHAKLKGNDDEFIFGLYANYLIIYNRYGIIQSLLKCKYDFTNLAFDPETNSLLLGSSVSGGDAIHVIRIDHPDWKKAFEELKPVGKLAVIESNIGQLQTQLEGFQPPSYQKRQNSVQIINSKPDGKTYQNLTFSSRPYLLQKYADRTEFWCQEIDSRFKYDKTADEIVNYVINKEKNKESFYIVTGHGNAVYMPLETMERIIDAGPKYFKGFVFAEFQSVETRMQQVIERIIFPLAEKCAQAGKKIVFENKNIFWGGTCYVDFWRKVLLNPKFQDVFIPALEESNSRTQEISLAGRVGLWATGAFDQWQSRSISDNPCFDRMWEWSSPQVLSHFIRHLVLTASMGSDHLAISIQQGPVSAELAKQLLPLYDLLEKGAVYIPKRGELLSMSDICLGMKSPPSQSYIKDGINSHKYNFNEELHPQKVFDRLGTNWGGAPIAEHDFSRYGYGCERRMLNFLPKFPFGVITIVPDTIDIQKMPIFQDKVTTDGEFFFDETGKPFGAEEYKPIMLEKLNRAAERLPVRVVGDAAWSVVKIDSMHLRITLVDPGYTDPDERNVQVLLQKVDGAKCQDILSGEVLPISNSAIRVNIPAGLFRIIDVYLAKPFTGISTITSAAQSDSFSKSSARMEKEKLLIYPNPGDGVFKVKLSDCPNQFGLNFTVFNSMGGKVSSTTRMKGSWEVNLLDQPAGVYFCQVISNNHILEGKYLKIK